MIDRYLAGSLLVVATALAIHQARAQTAAAPPAAQAAAAVPGAAAQRASTAPAKPVGRPANAIQPVKATAAGSAPAAAPSQSVVINLIRLLVQEGVLTQDKANALIRQAQDEAAAASRGQPAVVNTPSGAPKVAAAGAPQSVRVPYIPEVVRKQIRDEVKQEVLQQARAENWAAPDQFPDWVKSVRISGDFRLRNEWDVFDRRNCQLPNGGNYSCFANYSALNAGAPFDLNSVPDHLYPTLNTTNDRQRLRERFRLGIGTQINDEWAAGLRLATGNTTNPVSTNQTLGNSLSNDSFNLDRAFIRYQPLPWITAWLGRFPDPWFATDLVWDEDVNFDGVAVQVNPPLFGEELRPSVTIGAFPIANTPFNFPDATASTKAPSRDVWLYAAQAQTDWRPDPDYEIRLGLAYYYFNNIDGEFSSPCFATTSADQCDTDFTRPGFMQQGNSLFFLRNLVNNDPNNIHLFQYYGLASKFHELNLTARFDYGGLDPVHLVFDADFVKNLGFDRSAIAARFPVNNQGQSLDGKTAGPWDGGDSAYMARLTVGYPRLRDRWDWNFNIGYKYIESDAVVDAFTDSDFHLGGTNAKGYFVGAGIGIARDIDLSARWLSSREVTGSPYSVDVIQVDLNGRF